MKYISSPYFRVVFNAGDLQAGEEKLIDFRKDTKADRRYLPFNYLVVKNLSSIDIEIVIDDNRQADPLMIPAGSIIIIDNEVFDKVRVKNVGAVANDKPIYIEAKREIKEIDILKAIAQKLGASLTIHY